MSISNQTGDDKLLWLLLVCTSTGILVYQITDRVIYYYNWPVTVNVKVNYNSTVQFPAVTICNQNAFKATLAAERGWYKLIKQMYTNGKSINTSSVEGESFSKLKLDQLYRQTAHRKEDLIIKCSWKGRPCDMTRFVEEITDHGVCYTFFTNTQDGQISSPGLENGLKLILNVEQYEYMPGPHDAAGIKMLVHTPGEFPLVHALGQAIPTGNHVFAGIKLNMINNWPHPYGNCGAKNLDYVDVYSSEACRLDCQTRMAEEMCQCRNAYMLSKGGSPSVCTIKQYVDCLQHVEVHEDLWKCNCPVPCSFQIYESEVSYASTSYFSRDKLLDTENITALRQSLMNAKEVSARMDEQTYQSTVDIVQTLTSEYTDLRDIVLDSLKGAATKLESQIQQSYEKELEAYGFKERLYRFQIYNVQKNFMRGRDAMDERSCHIVALAYAEFGLAIENKVKKIMNETEPDVRKFFYLSALEMLQNKKQVVYMCMKNYSELYTAYKTGTKIFNYKFEDISRIHNNASIPKELIKSSVDHDEYAIEYGPKLGVRLKQTIHRLTTLEEIVTSTYEYQNTSYDVVENAVARLYQTMRRYLFAKSVFDEYIVEWPVSQLKIRLANFNSLWNTMNSNYIDLLQNLRSMNQGIQNVNITLININKTVLTTLNNYLFQGNVSKFSTTRMISSKDIHQNIAAVDNFFDQVRSREHRVMDTLTRLHEESVPFWSVIINDNDSIPYYEYVNRTDLTRDLSEILNETDINFKNNTKLSKFSSSIQNIDHLFLGTFEAVTSDFVSFRDSIQVDGDFLRQNILQLDIFYRQLSYEQIDQQIAYDFFALICDIGGSMGLFIGASVLSIFEILDFIMSQSLLNTRHVLTSEVKARK